MASPTPETNGKVKEIFYGYMYDDPKPDEIPIPKPKPLLDALLRALALHIVCYSASKPALYLTANLRVD